MLQAFESQFEEYLRDESRMIGHAESISFPLTEADICRDLRAAFERDSRITVQGGRTGVAAAAVPDGGHILNLSRMNRVLGCRINEQGRYCFRVQPGLVLTQLRKMIEKKRFATTGWSQASLAALASFVAAPPQFFPPDPTESSATLGGMAACNASGARSYRYGAMRKHICAARMALADGRVIALQRGQAKAKARHLTIPMENAESLRLELPTYQMPQTKNAAGYYVADDMDALDLLVGSDGTLGVFTELELELLPLPSMLVGVSCFFVAEAQAVAFVACVRATVQGVSSIEYFDGDALQLLRQQKEQNAAFAKLPHIPQTAAACVYIELQCEDRACADEQLLQLGELLSDSGGDPAHTWVARTDLDLALLLFFRHAMPECANMLIDQRKREHPIITKLGSDMAVPDGRLADILAVYRRGLATNGLQSAIWGHIGDNHLHVNILPRDEADYYQGKSLFREWAQVVTAMGGTVSAEHGVGKLKADFLLTMYGHEHIQQMRALKRCFDPKGLLGVGNLFASEREDLLA